MDSVLELQKRNAKGGRKLKSVRHDDLVPGIVYGQGFSPIMTQSPMNEMIKAVQGAGKHSPVHISIDGKKKLAMIAEIDVDPAKRRIRHVAFHAVKQNDSILA